ncbi:recombination protein RecR [Candidatus Peregrinibacteria bacterium]|nr:recombination protein RecR [Candidatus Peregrinibacteria bacterium]
MSNFLPKSVRNLIEELGRLPGIGPKSAQRLAIHLLYSPASRVTPLGEAVLGLKENVMFCGCCWNIAESDPCKICGDGGRDQGIICVVEDVLDVVALEKTSEFKGVYHVLHGSLSPIDGIGPEQLKIAELFARIEKSRAGADVGGDASVPVREVILATNPSLEGEATALYIQKHLREMDVKITRIARGLPVGADLEYADEITLTKALQGRGEF